MATTFEVTDPAVIAAIAGELPTVTQSKTIYVDRYRAELTGIEDGTQLNPFLTIQAAIDLALAPTVPTTKANGNVMVIHIGSGEYDEDLVIDLSPGGRKLRFVSGGAWILGDYDAAGAVTTQRNVTITGSIASNPAAGDAAVEFLAYAHPANHTSSASQVPRITGQFILDYSGEALALTLQVQVDGDTGDSTGTSISGTSITGNPVLLQLHDCKLVGGITGGSKITGRIFHNCSLGGDTVDVAQTQRVSYCDIDATDWTVTSVPSSSAPPGFTNCTLNNAMNFTGPSGSFIVDGVSNFYAKAAPVTLLGGATKVIADDLTP